MFFVVSVFFFLIFYSLSFPCFRFVFFLLSMILFQRKTIFYKIKKNKKEKEVESQRVKIGKNIVNVPRPHDVSFPREVFFGHVHDVLEEGGGRRVTSRSEV